MQRLKIMSTIESIMNSDTTSILNICLEIEGLLCLLERRGDATHKNVTQLLRSKSAALRDAVERLSESDFTECDEGDMASIAEDTAIVPDTIPACSIELESKPEKESAETVVENVVKKMEEPKAEASSLAVEKAAINDAVPIELTINDKFRFRRELFGNSDVDLAEALQVAASMASAEEAEDYFYNDLCFDPEKDVVKDFIRVVTSRF